MASCRDLRSNFHPPSIAAPTTAPHKGVKQFQKDQYYWADRWRPMHTYSCHRLPNRIGLQKPLQPRLISSGFIVIKLGALQLDSPRISEQWIARISRYIINIMLMTLDYVVAPPRVIFLAVQQASKKWTMPIRNWKPALNRFMIDLEDRLTDYI